VLLCHLAVVRRSRTNPLMMLPHLHFWQVDMRGEEWRERRYYFRRSSHLPEEKSESTYCHFYVMCEMLCLFLSFPVLFVVFWGYDQKDAQRPIFVSLQGSSTDARRVAHAHFWKDRTSRSPFLEISKYRRGSPAPTKQPFLYATVQWFFSSPMMREVHIIPLLFLFSRRQSDYFFIYFISYLCFCLSTSMSTSPP
jgi:hypothetical protein